MSSPIAAAASEGDLSKIARLLADGLIDERDTDGNTALIIAAENGHLEIVRFLLARGADIEARDKKGSNALCAAAGKGDGTVLSILLESGAEPNCRNDRGYSPLLLAAYSGIQNAVSVLLSHGSDPNLGDHEGLTPLLVAAYKETTESVIALLSAGANPNSASKDGKSPLMAAANRGALECVIALLQAGATAREDGAALLAYALNAPKNSDAVAIRIIEMLGVPLGAYQGHSPIFLAISQRRHEVVEALLDAGADPNQNSVVETQTGDAISTPLAAAASIGDTECVKILLRRGADPEAKIGDMTALEFAKFAGHEDVVRLLIGYGVTVGTFALLGRAEGDPGFEIRSLLATDLAVAWRISFENSGKEYVFLQEKIGNCPQIQERLALLRLNDPAGIDESYPAVLLLLLGLALRFIESQAGNAAQVIIANHIGIRKRREEEEKARTRCIEEVATMIARGTELYEDSAEALAAAEFVLSRFPYRELVERARSSAPHSTLRRDGVGYEEHCRNDLETNDYLARKTPASGDQGADLLASKAGVTYAIQCKNYAGAVGNAAVQEVISARTYYVTDYAIVVSDGTFTTSARELAAKAKVVLCKRESIGQIDVICGGLP
jgi:ankyrin repeat protein